MFIYQFIIKTLCSSSKLITFVQHYFIYIEKDKTKMMTNKKLNARKVIQALNYLSTKQKNGVMNKMKAYKLLCLADKYHIRQYERSITDDTYCALPHGTVPSNVMDLLSENISIDNGIIVISYIIDKY